MRTSGVLALLLACAAGTVSPALRAQERSPAEVRLQAALHAEEVEGNLAHAIDLYRDVVRRYGGERDVAARALLYLGRSYEKLGSQEATRAYQRVVREYGDQSQVAALARARLAALQATPAVAGRGPVARRLLSGEDADINNLYDMVPSPDGRRVAYSQLGSDGALYLRDLASGTVELLAPGLPAVWNARPVWSPDGRRLAFSESGMQSRRTFVKIMDLDSRSVATVPGTEVEWTGRATPGWMPLDWSRDGRFLLVSRGQTRSATTLGILPVAGGPVRLLTDSVADQGGAFSPDGRYVTYAERVNGSEQVFVHPVAGGERRQITSVLGGNGYPLWSPDGRAIAFRRSDGIWVAPVDGSAAAGVPRLAYAGEATFPAAWTEGGGLYLRLYNTVTNALQLPVDPATGVPDGRVEALPQPIPVAGIFAWSPDRQRIAFNSYDGQRPIIKVLTVDRNSTTSYTVLAPDERVWRMQWSTDGREINYTSTRGLLALDPVTGQSRIVASGGAVGRGALHQSADGRRTLMGIGLTQSDSTPPGLVVVESEETRGQFVAPARSAEGAPLSTWVRAQLSPQGDRVLFGRQANLNTGAASQRSGTLWVVGSDGTGLRQLATVDLIWSAVWAPSGRFIAYTGTSGGRAVLRVVDAAAGSERDVALPNPRAEQVIVSDWSRDGRLIGLVSGEARYEYWVVQGLLEGGR